jgi:hypothetical protein
VAEDLAMAVLRQVFGERAKLFGLKARMHRTTADKPNNVQRLWYDYRQASNGIEPLCETFVR